jgi:predicted dehydrogenase
MKSRETRPRLGFIGLGWIGRHRLQAVADSGVAEIAALCDPDSNAVEAARAIAPGAVVVGSMGELLQQPLDGIVIATPSAQHAQQSLAALERGVAVFCQKPLGRSASEVRALVQAAERGDRLLGVDLSYRRTDAASKLRALVASGEIGRVFAANLVFHNAYGPDKPWFYDAKLSGGGALVDLGIHLIDLLLWTLDFPKVVDVRSQLLAKGQPLQDRTTQVEDYVAAQLTLASGAIVQLACSWRLHAGCDCVIEASLYGTEGGVSLRNQSGSFYDFSTEAFAGTARRVLAAPPDAWGGRTAVDWAQRLAADHSFDPSAHHFVDVAEVIDRIYAGAACAS